MARPAFRPTKLLRALVAIIATDPNISARAALLRAGYSQQTATHSAKRTLASLGAQTLLQAQRETYRAILAEALPVADAARELAKIALKSSNDFAKLQALDKGLQHLGVVEAQDRKQVIVFAFTLCVNRFAPLVTEFVPDDLKAAFARRVSEVFELEASQVNESVSQEKQGLQAD